MSPRPLRSLLPALTAAALLSAAPALADWTGDLRLKNAPPGQDIPVEMKGKMYGRAGLLRMDVQMPAQQGGGTLSIIFDWEKRTGTMLMHSRKLASQRSLDDMPVKLPGSCMGEGQDFDTCFRQQGYKKVGSAKVNGHSTTQYEGKLPGGDGKPQVQKLWRPTSLPEVPYVRTQTLDAAGRVATELDVLDIKVEKQPDALFTVPADYRMMPQQAPGALPGGFKPEDFQGKTPEQIQEMIHQRMGQGGARPQTK